MRAFVAGINAYHAANRLPIEPWTLNDVAAMGALIGAVFGAGGGDETRRSMFLDALQHALGDERGKVVFDDLRDRNDPETPTTIAKAFPWEEGTRTGVGNATVDDGSFVPVTYGAVSSLVAPRHKLMSNALLVGRNRSTNGHPLFVAGPQVGHFYPQLLLELDLHGGGIDARGAAFPGISFYVLLGRGKDYAWSLTSSTSDLIDDYAEELCGDDTHYRYQGACREMGSFDAGTLKGAPGEADRRLLFRTTVHGPVIGYATVGGRRVAIARKRATRGRELLSGLAWQDLNTNKPRNAAEFLRSASRLEMSFNWVYADDRDIATFSSGRLPIRPDTVDPGLPTSGNGDFEWRGLLPFARHPQAISPASGELANWNNKPAPGFTAADDQWSYGSVQRVDLLRNGLAARRTHTLATVVSAMNAAATQDLRAVEVWPTIRAVLDSGPAPSARAQSAAQLVDDWRAQGASRLDRDLDGWIDHPGRRRAGRRLAQDRRRGAVPSPRPARLAPPPGQRRPRRAGRQRERLRQRLVRLRRQGSPHPARTPCDRPLPDALLRRRRSGRLPHRPLGRSRRDGGGAAGRSGSRSRPLARRRDRGARALRGRPPASHDALRKPADVPAGHDLHRASAAVSVGCQTGVRPGRNTPGKGGWLG